MAKRHILVDTPSAKRQKAARTTNWELCILCQEDTGAALECPINSRRAPIGSGYVSLATHLTKFSELGQVPMNIDIARLDDGDGIEATLMRHSAQWHKACCLRVNQTKLERLETKSKESDVETCPSAVTTRSRQDRVDLAVLPDLKAHSQGRDVLLTFDVGNAIRKVCDHDSDAMQLARAAQIVRKEMFDKEFSFDGSFKPECQQDSVPKSLLALLNMILKGPNIEIQTEIVTEFENCALVTEANNSDHRHHEQYASVQATFITEVRSLTAVIEDMESPFLEKSNDLLVLDTRNIMDVSVGETVRKIEALGMQQYDNFVKERLTECTVPITEVLPKNKLALFSSPPIKCLSKQKMQVSALKSDCNLFSRRYISCQTRDGDLATFFMHENQSTPPSLSLGGKLRLGMKADLLHCLQLKEIETNTPVVNAKFFDSAAVVQMLHPKTAKAFQDYADAVFTS